MTDDPILPAYYVFGAGLPTPPTDRAEVGGKGAGLIEMTSLGLPVPPGIVLPTSAYRRYAAGGWTAALDDAVRAGLARLEEVTGRRLGDPERPLLVSVRSGAPVSMPGMMDTVLDVGMTAPVEAGLARATGDATFARNTRLRFLCGYSSIVSEVPAGLIDQLAATRSPDQLADALAQHGAPVPDDPIEQVIAATEAIFRSWDADRARTFRQREGIADDLGTAAVIQAMVFGNLGPDSGTGVVFSRDPSTGAPGMMGDFLVEAQGEDVVAGTHQTLPVAAMADRWPAVHAELVAAVTALERHRADMVDVEFTVEQGRLHVLQTRRGRRSAAAAARLAVEMADDPAFPLDRAEAVASCRSLLETPPVVHTPLPAEVVAEHLVTSGLAASPGRGTGVLVVSVDDALRRHDAGQEVVLVRPETSPADVAAMVVAAGIVTIRGGLVSHAAVVARSWGLPATVGAGELEIDDRGVTCGGKRIAAGEVVTVDGSAGLLLAGAHLGDEAEPPHLAVLRRWDADLDAPAAGPSADEPALEVDELTVLRLVALRGRTNAAAVADVLAADPTAVAAVVAGLQDQDHLTESGPFVAPTATGRALVTADVAACVEQHGPAFAAILDRFHHPNMALKEILTAWQIRGGAEGAEANDHGDAAYDRAVIERLRAEVHAAATGIIDEAAALLPRLGHYRRRLDGALARLDGGDPRYLANPRLDSYHTAWFEMHEEIIGLAGTDRATETAAGRA